MSYEAVAPGFTPGGVPILSKSVTRSSGVNPDATTGHSARCPPFAGLRTPLSTAFTLLELLVVVAIIGILAGVAVPRLLGARDRAEVTHCAANLRAIHVALGLYRVDYGRYPLADGEAGDTPSPGKTVPGKGPAANGSWDAVPLSLHALGYLPDRDVFFCPVMKRLAGERQQYFRYAYNAGTADTGGYAAGSGNIERDEGEIWLARCVYLLPEETFTPAARYPFPHQEHKAENVLYSDGRVVLEQPKRGSARF